MASDEAQARYPMILPEDWEELGYVTLSQERLFVHLDGRIHDLFKYTVDGKPMKTWVKQTPRQYQVIRAVLEPVFQLATNILLSPASLDWFYYLIFSSRTLTDPPIQHNGDDVYVYRHDDTPMVTRHQKAKAALQRLAMVHTIELEDLDGDDHDDEGRTEPRTDRLEQGVNIKDDSPRISGIGPRVTMSRAFLRDFLRMCMEGSQSLEELHVMVTKMALAFIHELAVSRPSTPRDLYVGFSEPSCQAQVRW